MNKSTKITLFILRIALGWVFLWAGFTKILAPAGWSAKGYLLGATGPFADWFKGMAGNPIVDNLNMWGLALIGISLLAGGLVRWSSIGGALLMLFYYFAYFKQNTAHGLIDDHLIYLFIFVFFIAIKAGEIWGLDKYLKRIKILSKII